MYSFPLVPSFSPWSVTAQFLDYVSDYLSHLEKALSTETPFRKGRSGMHLSDTRAAQFTSLMRSVKPTEKSGKYLAPPATHPRTRLWAEVSGDKNDVHINPKKPHPLFGGLIAHGMDPTTSALVALKKHLRGSKLIPSHVALTFWNPLLLDEGPTPLITIVIPEGEPFRRRITVTAGLTTENEPKKVITLEVMLHEGILADRHWLETTVSGWRISTLLAETWAGCLFYSLSLSFPQSSKKTKRLVTEVRGVGRTEKGHGRVEVMTHDGRGNVLTKGMATIVLPRKSR
ncbi:MAG: hypothetical protein ABI747_02990 [Candidatus Moraniibacteriota bacterium]